jgi:hypothetical protein
MVRLVLRVDCKQPRCQEQTYAFRMIRGLHRFEAAATNAQSVLFLCAYRALDRDMLPALRPIGTKFKKLTHTPSGENKADERTRPTKPIEFLFTSDGIGSWFWLAIRRLNQNPVVFPEISLSI